MKNDQLIEKYIQNNLTPEETLVFDELLKNDIEFEKDVVLHKNLKKAIRKEDELDFRKLILKIENKAKTSLRTILFSKWVAAASIILLLGFSYFLTLNNKLSTNELFENYFEPYRNVIQPIERGDEQEDEKTLAFSAYEKREFEMAILLFSKLYKDTKEPYYLFYKANALLKLEKAKEAVPLLLEHFKTQDTLAQKSQWFLALAYLKLNNKVEAKKVLKKVIADGEFKTKEAVELLKKFD